MLPSRSATRRAAVARTAAHPRSAARPSLRLLERPHQQQQQLHHSAQRTHRTGRTPWKFPSATAAAIGVAAIGAYTLWELKPEWTPAVSPLLAEASSSPNNQIFLDPTTQTPFPHRLTAPDGTTLRLVGTGVRTVSFLNIRVYTAAFYVSERELEAAQEGRLAGWEGYSPERLIPPFAIPPGSDVPERLEGEQLMETLLEKADAAVIIIPLRNTSLSHLRDGFSRALVARMKVPRVSNEFTDSMNASTGAALVDFKSFFPNKNLAKGMPLELYYSAKERSVTFQLRNEKTRSPEILGTLRDALLSRELIVSYFSDTAAPSRELVQNVAMGLAREAGSPTAISA
ncbi:hypothetical protein JCM10908_001728 [Rhodotorula pacifica]|uniref:uncharacterized protein n=1 Tax=Rhodotorula pacifica TaxID=1495444 RepID=UPI0031705ABF